VSREGSDVADTEASLSFYRDTLNMKTVGESETYGREQEHLNNVFSARLRITSLHAQAGPGIELMGIAKRFQESAFLYATSTVT
jgi:hypothetical protein